MVRIKMLLFVLLLSSCSADNSQTPPTTNYVHQPIEMYQQPYPLECSSRLPMTPVCISTMGGALYSMMSPSGQRASFESCKLDVKNFIKAVKFQAECYQTSLESYVEEALMSVNERVVCEEQQIQEIESGSQGQICPAVDAPPVPDILNKDDYSTISEIDPVQISAFACGMIANKNDLEMRQLCVDELKNGFLSEAQSYYDEQLDYLYNGRTRYPNRRGVKKYIDEVVEQFNCKASGQSYCF